MAKIAGKSTAEAGKTIHVRGAREHNLKNVDLEIPRDALIVFTGLSGSGKSSLAFDTIYAEGQRRYVESLSAYARQFLEMMQKPDVDHIDGLSPAISIEQKTTSKNPRSTVGTVTEIYDYLRLLFARVGVPYSPATGLPIESQTVTQMVDRVLALPEGTRLYLLSPIVRGRKGEYRKELADLQKKGFQRVKINGQFYEIAAAPKLDKKYKHDIDVVVDRLVVRKDIAARLADSFETALGLADGIAIAEFADRPLAGSGKSTPRAKAATGSPPPGGEGLGVGGNSTADALGSPPPPPSPTRGEGARAERDEGVLRNKNETHERIVFSARFACPVSGFTIDEIEPRLFSFNAPAGACPKCDGLGTELRFEADLIVPDPTLSLKQGAVYPWAKTGSTSPYYEQTLEALAKHFKVAMSTPWEKLGKKVQEAILYGTGEEEVEFVYEDGVRRYKNVKPFEGVIHNIERRFRETESDWVREELSRYQMAHPCDACGGYRLKPQALAVKIDGLHIGQVTDMSIRAANAWFAELPKKLSKKQNEIAVRVLKEIRERLQFLVDVGLDYLTLSRAAGTLSGGESQRIRLASQIGSGLTGVLYVLDEPSIGLHQRDNARLLETLKHLRDIGNTVIVVEHDEDAILSADYVVDIGPGAGIHGGHIVAQGPPDAIMASPDSITGQFLTGVRQIPMPKQRRKANGKSLEVIGARANNLKDVTAAIPLGLFTCITGVSGGGKSTLLIDTLYKAVARRLNNAREHPGAHDRIEGLEHLDKVIDIDQSPIGRTPRSNPATYTGAFTPIREWFAGLPESKARGYQP
ncbi:MAG TPA: excinuclease ABC subunit UvrA, partial [Hyphomicrobiaceae bacterium]|nr:excinuclease ABC subunit UvrA [Hyphomicrobiaceae bacterium]